MSALLELGIVAGPFDRVVADVAIAGFFTNERPLRGAAGLADWRLCGLVSDLLAAARLPEKVGQAVLLPTYGRLAATRVLLISLGRRSSLSAARIHEASAAAVRRGILLGARRIALDPPTGDEAVARHAGTLLRAALHAVIEARAEVAVDLVAGAQAAPARRAFEHALEAQPAPEVRLVSARQGPIGVFHGRPTPTGPRPALREPTPDGC